MCANCWEERFAKAQIDNGAVRTAVKAIANVYDHGCCGGNLHCEVDDWNIEDGFFTGDFKPCDPNVPEEQLAAEQMCYDLLKSLSEAERASALALYDGYWS